MNYHKSIYYLLIFIATFVIVNVNVHANNYEDAALNMLKQAEALTDSDWVQAAKLFEDVILNYPNTKASKDSSEKLATWKHGKILKSIQDRFSDSDTTTSSKQIGSVLTISDINQLAHILRSFPEYKYRDILEAQIVMFVFIRELVPSFLNIQENLIVSQREANEELSAGSSSDRMYLKLVIEFKHQKVIFEELTKAFFDAGNLLQSIRSENMASSFFQEGSSVFKDYSVFLANVLNFQEYRLKKENYSCMKVVWGLIQDKNNMSKCEFIWDHTLDKGHDLEVQSAILDGRLSDLTYESNLYKEKFFSKFNGYFAFLQKATAFESQ